MRRLLPLVILLNLLHLIHQPRTFICTYNHSIIDLIFTILVILFELESGNLLGITSYLFYRWFTTSLWRLLPCFPLILLIYAVLTTLICPKIHWGISNTSVGISGSFVEFVNEFIDLTNVDFTCSIFVKDFEDRLVFLLI